MKSIFLFLFVGTLGLFNAQSNLTVFNNGGQKFFLILNGIKQNSLAQTNVGVSGIKNGGYSVKIIFEDGKTGDIEKNFVIDAPYDITTRVTFKKGKGKLQLVSILATTGTQSGSDVVVFRPDNSAVYSDAVVITTRPTDRPQMVTETISTQTVTQTTGNGSMGINVNSNANTNPPNGNQSGNGSMGINVNVSGNDGMNGTNGQTNGSGNGSMGINVNVSGNEGTNGTNGQTNGAGNGSLGIQINVSENDRNNGNNGQLNGVDMNINVAGSNGTSQNNQNSSTTTITTTTTQTNTSNSQSQNNQNVNQTVNQSQTVLTNGRINCQSTLTNASVLIAEWKNQSFEDDRSEAVRLALKKKCLTSTDAKAILGLFSFDETVLDVAKYLSDRLTDYDNASSLSEKITFEDSRMEYLRYIARD